MQSNDYTATPRSNSLRYIMHVHDMGSEKRVSKYKESKRNLISGSMAKLNQLVNRSKKLVLKTQWQSNT